MNENYVYPALFQREGGGIRITFPDFPELMVTAGDWQEGMEQARRQLAMAVIDRVDGGREVPESGSPEEVKAAPEAELVYLHIWLPYYRSNVREVYVKKSVTIPQWLDTLAKESGINFSAALVKGIKEELGIQEKKDI